MKLDELIEIVNKGYPDDMIMEAFNNRLKLSNKGIGDDLAVFIVREITETFNENMPDIEQLTEALRVLECASTEIDNVMDILLDARDERVKL